MKGRVHVYFGDGKGKTTAAAGLAARAAGAGLRVAFIQFLKDGSSSELKGLCKLGVECRAFGRGVILNKVSAQDRRLAELGFACSNQAVSECDVVVLDELLDALKLGLVSEGQILELIEKRAHHSELVITGHEATETLKQRADYLTEMKACRHPFNEGVSARKGIEF
jgi:cob(I)alamin adenosyltransferase